MSELHSAPPPKVPPPAVGTEERPPEQSPPSSPSRNDGLRETIESIAVAFILAFLFRTFEAEAFVIPTGSMAPTLYGRHKDVECEQCRYHFTVSASEEVDNNGLLSSMRLETAVCPNCGYENYVRNAPVFNGDRILVNKFPYEFGDPKRWDVVVFKYPEEPVTNYIKRLVGLPGETIEIARGDLYRLEDSGERQILRKSDPNKQRELQLLVYDNDYPERLLHEHGWPERWAAVTYDQNPGSIAGWSETDRGWQSDSDRNAFRLDSEPTSDGELRWLRYRHFRPAPSDWETVDPQSNSLREAPTDFTLARPAPQLITDLYGYNSFRTSHYDEYDSDDAYWVGDLTLNARIQVSEIQRDGELVLELNEGARRYQCRIELDSGAARLIVGTGPRSAPETIVLARGQTPLSEAGRYDVVFANVDNRLCLWVDDALVDFGPSAAYILEPGTDRAPQEADLIPVGIAARRADVDVSDLRIERDIYYRSEHVTRPDDYYGRPGTSEESRSQHSLRRLISNPRMWGEQYETTMVTARFELGPDEFLMLGDNSPRSKDSRLWSNTRRAEHRHAVPRSALIGKAFFVYWPHGIPFLNDGKGYPVTYHKQVTPGDGFGDYTITRDEEYPELRFPFYPNVSRMQRIR